MNPQGREDNQPSPPTAPIVESNVGASSNPLAPLAGLEDVVNAAKEAAAVQTVTAPAQSPEKTPEENFVSQFGEKAPPVEPMATTPPTSQPPDLMGQALANLGTTPPAVDGSNPQPEQTQPVETLAPEPEVTSATQSEEEPSDPRQKFKDDVSKAAEEILKALEEKKAA